MPTVKKELPKTLQPFVFHGLDFDDPWSEHPKAECPFCGKDKFWVNASKGTCGCFVCGADDAKEIYTFLRKLWKRGVNGLDKLAADRKLLDVSTLLAWEVVHSPLTGDPLVPGYSTEGVKEGKAAKLCQLYSYRMGKDGKRILLPTPTLGHRLHGLNLYNPRCSTVYVCEGPWDGMALWEVMRQAKQTDEGLVQTASEASSLLADASIIAVPGCGSIGDPFRKWMHLLAGKRVVLCFDSDHPKTVHGKQVLGAGYLASKRAAELLASADVPPESVHWIKWGEEGYDATRSSGHDVRDHLCSGMGSGLLGRLQSMQQLLEKVETIPESWVKGRTKAARRSGGTQIELLPCDSWNLLIKCWGAAIKLTPGLNKTLSVLLAQVLSTPHMGEQLWTLVLGPASSAKTTLCEACSTNKRYVKALDTFTGLTSGFQIDKEGKENQSLVGQLHNKLLIINDGDTLLKLPNREQIMSQLRAFFSRNLRAKYGNKMSMDNEGINCTVCIAGTWSLFELDTAELGSRYLLCSVGDIDEDVEDEIGWKIACQTEQDVGLISDGTMESRDNPKMSEAKLRTGGYINHLREDSKTLIDAVQMDDHAKRKCQQWAKFIAFMRSRPAKKQEEKVGREMSFRLISQLVRFAKCLAAVRQHPTVDDTILYLLREIVLDTSHGRTYNLCQAMVKLGPDKSRVGSLCKETGHSEDKERVLLRHLRMIGAAGDHEVKTKAATWHSWRLTPTMQKLWESIHIQG